MTGTEPRLEHQTFKVRQLVEDYRAGRIVIPEFQREYVWRGQQGTTPDRLPLPWIPHFVFSSLAE